MIPGMCDIDEKFLTEKYDNIEIEKQGNILVIKLFKDKERSVGHFVRIAFIDSKIFYSGDMGTFVFGKDIVHPLTFFKGKEINPEYWWGKCEAAQYPMYNNCVNVSTVISELQGVLCKEYGVSNFEDLDEYIKEEYDKYIVEFEDEEDDVFDNVSDLLNSLGFDDGWSIARECVDKGKVISYSYLYCCNVLQWVENMLEIWLKERGIEYSEQPSR